MEFEPRKVKSLEGLLKSLSSMKNADWNFYQWSMFFQKADDCAELVNELNRILKAKEAEEKEEKIAKQA